MQAVRPVVRQQITQFLIPAIKKIVQDEFKKFKVSQSIIADSTSAPQQSRRQVQNRTQVRANFEQKLGLNNFNPKDILHEYGIPGLQQNRTNIMTSRQPDPIVQDDDFDPMSFDAPPGIINESVYADPYESEDQLDDVDQTIGYKTSVVENPLNLKKLGLKIKY